uniref:ferroxidase n=1 Tax=Hucho hucho TaxID=62062 RepID=A0A4W5PZR1_9TELE
MPSQIRQNYHSDCETAIDLMINMLMFSSYTYTSMAIKKMGDHVTNLTKMDAVKNKMAEYLFDKHTLGDQS